MAEPIARLSLLALDCRDPRALAAFYQRIVGGDVDEAGATEEWVRLRVPGGCDLGFQLDPSYEPLTWPEGPSQQAHLDLDVPGGDLDGAEAAAIAVGARKAAVQPDPANWRVLLDPEGHPFCLIRR